MSQYLRMEQEAGELTLKQKTLMDGALSEHREMTGAERDEFFTIQGAAQTLEVNARELRDAELTLLRENASRTPDVNVPDVAIAEFKNYMRFGTPMASVTTTDANGGYIVN